MDRDGTIPAGAARVTDVLVDGKSIRDKALIDSSMAIVDAGHQLSTNAQRILVGEIRRLRAENDKLKCPAAAYARGKAEEHVKTEAKVECWVRDYVEGFKDGWISAARMSVNIR